MKRKLLVVVMCLSALIITGCSVSERTVKNAEKRIQTLLDNGVPDSSLSRAKVFLYQVKDARDRQQHGFARTSADSMRILIAQAEDAYKKDMERLKPYLASLRSKFQQVHGELSGLHQAKLDSIVKIIDSLTAKNWLIHAEAKSIMLDTLIPRLKFDQQRANELRSRVLGTWVCTQVTKNDADKTVNAVEKKSFTFGGDGKAQLVENKQGKSSPFLIEDWEYRSWGTWDLLGDTIYLAIDRFAAVRQNFDEYHNRDGKITWEKKVHPTYDSAITDGSQNRWVTFDDLSSDFKQQ